MAGISWGDIGGMVALCTLIAGMFGAVAKFALVKPLENRIDQSGNGHYSKMKADNAAAIAGCRDELKTEIHGARDELRREIRTSREDAQSLVRNHVEDMHRGPP